jgi:murein DD-endopeptidase MepM/ murein hydrolase activator NlpD
VADPIYTVLIVPERSAHVRRFKVARRLLVRGACAALAGATLIMFLLVHYLWVVGQAAQNVPLKQENVALKVRLRGIQDELARIDASLQRIDQMQARIRNITQLHDPERNLAMGPLAYDPNAKTPEVLYASGERIDYEDENLDSKLALRLINGGLDHVHNAATQAEDAARAARDYFAVHDILLATTPSVRPTRSRLLTSAFGLRTDPYTDRQVMHKGVDYAADQGAEVLAPADGCVVFAGNRGNGYGQSIVLDHGFGVQTHYAHLSRFTVHVGERVRRGQVLGAVGNTGRSTVAHLHYEVRFQGIPQDPEQFILD